MRPTSHILSADEGKLPPQAPDIEQAILGAILIEWQTAMAEVGDALREEVFYVHAHGIIFRAIHDLYERGDAIDLLTVADHLKRSGDLEACGGAFYLSSLANKVASTRHIRTHTLIVLQYFIARETIRLNNEAMTAAYDGEDVFDLVPDTIAKLEESLTGSLKRRAVRYSEAEADQLSKMDQPRVAIPTTGFRALDRIIGGYMVGNLVVVAARPGMGKSAFAFSSAMECAESGSPTLFFSMELNEEQGQARMFSRKENVPLERVLKGEMSASEIQRRHDDQVRSSKLPLFMRYDTDLSVADIKAEITRTKRSHGITTVFIDQLNWIKAPKAQNRDNAIGEITRGLKKIALQCEVCIVLLHQLNRGVEGRGGDKRPMLSDLRDSGNVEQDAQVVLFPYRPEYYGITEDGGGSTIGIIEVAVAKNSNGPLGTERLRFTAETASVSEDAPPFRPTSGFAPHPDNRTEQAPF